ncbi:hypothetical protein D8674_040825 [Pyrus ussuriensis x Pyrus communis]|uniref:Bromo-adjacent domain-containing protein n=1 Tax=Pyrus ussuriensis x Pyrus communis TaxID=2448454 RepID=A0A5N5I1U2_9ROSA|nr:hypothetical protein D8674_040825 [Pyrus ussuriensis x Pyrus communis]
MGLEMNFDRSCTVNLSPNTVLPTNGHRSHVENRSTKGKLKRKDDLLSIKEDFVEITFHRYRSASCKSVPSRPVVNVDLKHGLIYQSSKEVQYIKKMGTVEGRRKVQMPHSSDTSFSYRIVDTMCSSDEESSQNRSAVVYLKSDLNAPSVGWPHVEPCLSDSLIDICMDLDNREKHFAEALRDFSVDLKLRSDAVAGPLNNGNELLERDQVHTLHKSFSAKVEMLLFPSPPDSARSSRVSSKTRLSPIRKMFDPFMKSKSLRTPSYVVEPGGAKTTVPANRSHQKSVLPVFSNTVESPDCEPQFTNRDNHQSSVACSPVHLYGHLKLQNKHGMPFFKTWKADNAINWMYTFHSIGSRKKSNASGWGLYGSDRDSSMVGQMQVSCYLCSELKDGVFINSMVTEFVLYDIVHARQTCAVQENWKCTPDDVKPPKGSNSSTVGASLKPDESFPAKVKFQQKHASENSDNYSSARPSADLHPNLEIAAIIMQVPLAKRESLKYKTSDNKKEVAPDSRSPGNLLVVAPAGNHGMPSAESSGPSSLLDWWRLGGGCDCGVWDMSCPLTVLSNPHTQSADNQLLAENQKPMELFVQGSKEKAPALTMTMVEEGRYAVDFHAQLYTLQAFSTCVAILHGTETSAAVGQ